MLEKAMERAMRYCQHIPKKAENEFNPAEGYVPGLTVRR